MLVVVFAIQLFAAIPEYWPVTRWAMYKQPVGPPATYQQLAVNAVVANDKRVWLHPQELGFLAEDIVGGALSESEFQSAYRALLVERVKEALHGDDIVEISIWMYSWTVNKWETPPFQLDQPADTVKLSSFLVRGDLPDAD
jgi:hypothetical protein